MKFKAILTVLILLYFIIFGCKNAGKSNQQKQIYQDTILSGNPVIEGWYADPEAIISNNEYWIFPTFSDEYNKQVSFDSFSSKDLITWVKHPGVLDTSIIKWAHRALWAPSIIEKDGLYYLFFSANDIQKPGGPYWDENNPENHTGGIGIAAAASPAGPFRDYLNKPLISEFFNEAQPIDQFVFKDYDNTYYIIYGGWRHCNMGILNDDFTEIIPWDDSSLFKEITPEGYVEGPFIFEREGIYYFMWSEGSWGNDTYKVAYAMAGKVTGPYIKTGTILQSDKNIATGAGHNSVINIPHTDDWLIVYHRRPVPNLGRDHRVTCIDKLEFNNDGTIKQIEMTFEGVKKQRIETQQN